MTEERYDRVGVAAAVYLQAAKGFAVVAVLLFIVLMQVNLTAQQDAEDSAPGNIMVEIQWPESEDIDVDLWVHAPGDIPVGYSNLAGRVFNLLRDDVGTYMDPLSLNYENSYTRGLPPGEYTVNLHWFANRSARSSVPVTVLVTLRPPQVSGGKTSLTRVFSNQVQLNAVGEELTVVRFEIDADGHLVRGSVNNIQQGLRSAGVPQEPPATLRGLR